MSDSVDRRTGRGPTEPGLAGATLIALPTLPHGRRVYAIGDVHGRADLLALILSAIDRHVSRYPIERATIVLLGDYIDRGFDSKGVIDMLIAREARGEDVVALGGNHEDMLLQALLDPDRMRAWLSMGGTETLRSYGIAEPPGKMDIRQSIAGRFAAALGAAHVAWLCSRPLTHRIGDFLFVHAGIRPGIALEQQVKKDLLWIRGEFLDYEKDHGVMVVHGHTPVRRPEFRPNRINIDTGAFATGVLSCLVIEGSRIQLLDVGGETGF